MNCKDCGLPVYPAGVSYTGSACMWQGHHPIQSASPALELEVRILTQSIKELTEAVRSISVNEVRANAKPAASKPKKTSMPPLMSQSGK